MTNQKEHQDHRHVRDAVRELNEIPALRTENEKRWAALSETERIGVLQEAENRLATSQGRPPQTVYGFRQPGATESITYGELGERNGKFGIHINTHTYAASNRAEMVNTLVHEGRHAYQDHAVTMQGFHGNTKEVKSWAWNYPSRYHHSGARYYAQPNERDAYTFANEVTSQLYPGHQPQRTATQAKIDNYHKRVADQKYRGIQRLGSAAKNRRGQQTGASGSKGANGVNRRGGTTGEAKGRHIQRKGAAFDVNVSKGRGRRVPNTRFQKKYGSRRPGYLSRISSRQATRRTPAVPAPPSRKTQATPVAVRTPKIKPIVHKKK